jgi:alpha-mannosidase
MTDFMYKTPFALEGPGSANIILETIKRGDDDDFSCPAPSGAEPEPEPEPEAEAKKNETQTVVLRLYEAYGGSTRAKLRMYAPTSPPLTLLQADTHSTDVDQAS